MTTESELHHINTSHESRHPSDDQRRLSEQLLTASGKGLEKLVPLLLGRGADVNHPRQDGWTPLMAACSVGHFAVVESLLVHKADVGATASDGFTALLEACTYGHNATVQLLLEHNANPCVPATDGTTPLILASLHGHLETVSMLLDYKADVDHQKPNGFSALRASCANGHTGVVKLLIEHGAAVNREDGAEALVSACANGQVSVVRYLIEKGVPVTSTSVDGSTALMKACLAGHKDVAALLMEHGADVDAVLDTARRQNTISGVRRVLNRVKLPSKAPAAETRDLDDLVLQIEGPKAPERRKKHSPATSAIRSPNNRLQHRSNSPKASSSSSSSSEEEEATISANNDGVQDKHEAHAAAYVEESEHVCIGPEIANEKPTAVPFPAVPFAQTRDAPCHIVEALGVASSWAVRRLPTMHGKAGTYYTIEVLCSEQTDTSDASQTLGFDSCVRSTLECNAAVMDARCRGWPVGELRLLPLEETEIADALHLVDHGIPHVSMREPMQVSSPPCSSTSSSLPDRDAIEEYAAWCLEARRRCLQAPKRTVVEIA